MMLDPADGVTRESSLSKFVVGPGLPQKLISTLITAQKLLFHTDPATADWIGRVTFGQRDQQARESVKETVNYLWSSLEIHSRSGDKSSPEESFSTVTHDKVLDG